MSEEKVDGEEILDLDSLLMGEEGEPAKAKRGRPKGSTGVGNHIPYTHDALIDAMIMNPSMSRTELGAMFGFTSQWVYSVTNSDGFRARYEARRKEVVNPEIVASVKERFDALASQSIDVIAHRLTASNDPLLALKTLEISAKASSYGARNEAVTVNQSFVVALPEKSQSADDWAKKYSGRTVEQEGGE